jgi:magnesium chelatase subunit I
MNPTTTARPASLPAAAGALRASGWTSRSVKDEVRANLIARRRAGTPLFPGIVGFDRTVIPAVENALLARHDFILLGLRGQAKSRLLRALSTLLDPWLPVVRGCEIHDDPLAPVCKRCRRLAAEKGDALEIDWIPPAERYREKLATPDVTVADLVGDVDPIKAATQRLTYADEEAITYGIVPRTNRGIFAVNELPDLPARIQVAFLDILEERDLQIRGFPVRLPLDLLVVFSANPEDYTNRGSIITPLKDRIDSQVLTHYPRNPEDARAITRQEAWSRRDGPVRVELPEMLENAVEEAVFEARRSEFVDPASGVSQRAAISAVECVVSNAERRGIRTGEAAVRARVADLFAAVPALVGKMELVYEGEQQGTEAVARRVLGTAVRRAFEARFPPVHGRRTGGKRHRGESEVPEPEDADYKPVVRWFAAGNVVETADDTTAAEHRKALDGVDGLADLARRHGAPKDAEDETLLMELALEGLHQCSVIARDDLDGRVSYKDMLKEMLAGMEGDD